jgi:hypothetical protein
MGGLPKIDRIVKSVDEKQELRRLKNCDAAGRTRPAPPLLSSDGSITSGLSDFESLSLSIESLPVLLSVRPLVAVAMTPRLALLTAARRCAGERWAYHIVM